MIRNFGVRRTLNTCLATIITCSLMGIGAANAVDEVDAVENDQTVITENNGEAAGNLDSVVNKDEHYRGDAPAEPEENNQEQKQLQARSVPALNDLSVVWEGVTEPTTQVAGKPFTYTAKMTCQSDIGVGTGCENVKLVIPFDQRELPSGAAPFASAGWNGRMTGYGDNLSFYWLDQEHSGVYAKLPRTIEFGETVTVTIKIWLDGTTTPATEYTWGQPVWAEGTNTNRPTTPPVTYTATTLIVAPGSSWHWNSPAAIGGGQDSTYNVFPGSKMVFGFGVMGYDGMSYASTNEYAVGAAPDSGIVTVTLPEGMSWDQSVEVDPKWPTPVWDEDARTLTYSGLNNLSVLEGTRVPVPLMVDADAQTGQSLEVTGSVSIIPIAFDQRRIESPEKKITVKLIDEISSWNMAQMSYSSNRSGNQKYVGPSPTFPETSGYQFSLYNATSTYNWKGQWGIPCRGEANKTIWYSDFSGTCNDPVFIFSGFNYQPSNEDEKMNATIHFTDGSSATVDIAANPQWKLADSEHAGKTVQTIDFSGNKIPSQVVSKLVIMGGLPDTVPNQKNVNSTMRVEMSVTDTVPEPSDSSRKFSYDLTMADTYGTSTHVSSAGTTSTALVFNTWTAPTVETHKAAIVVPAGLTVTKVSEGNGEDENVVFYDPVLNYDGSGATLLRVDLKGDIRSSYIRVDYSSPYSGIYPFESYILGDEEGSAEAFTDNKCWSNGSAQTSAQSVMKISGDLFGIDGEVSACGAAKNNIITATGTGYAVDMRVKNANTPQWVGAPGLDAAAVEGTNEATYQVTAANTGSNSQTNMVVYDFLPRVGDERVAGQFAGQNRGSEFPVTLTNKPTAAGATISYTTEENVCAPEIGIDTNCANNAWSTTAPADLSTVKGLKFDYGTATVTTGSVKTMTVPVQLGNHTADDVAWNSAVMSAKVVGGNDQGPAVETRNVGFVDIDRPGDYAVSLSADVADADGNPRTQDELTQATTGDLVTYTMKAERASGTNADPRPVVVDDISEILGSESQKAELVDGSLTTVGGGTVRFDADSKKLIWDTAAIGGNAQTASFTVRVKDQADLLINNAVTASQERPSGNALLPVSCSETEGDESCRSTSVYVPRTWATLTADPEKGSTVEGGKTIIYRIQAWTEGMVAGLETPNMSFTADLSDVLAEATLSPDSLTHFEETDGIEYDADSKILSWTVEAVNNTETGPVSLGELPFEVALGENPTSGSDTELTLDVEAAFVGDNAANFALQSTCGPTSGEVEDCLSATHNFAYTDHTVDPTFRLVFDRMRGEDRYLTSNDVNKNLMETGKPLFIATGELFPDALTAGAAVTHVDGSLMLSRRGGLAQQNADLIRERKPSEVYIIGLEKALNTDVANQVRSIVGNDVPIERVGGADRFETAVAIYNKFFKTDKFGEQPDQIFVATGMDYPDALTASAVAGVFGSPVLLVRGQTETTIPDAIKNLILEDGIVQTNLVGGTAAINKQTEDSFKSMVPTKRFSGDNRYATNLAINSYLDETFPAADVDHAWIATGLDFPDALSGAAVAGSPTSRLYLAYPTCVPKPIVDTISKPGNLEVRYVTLLGGMKALNSSIENFKAVCK